MADLLVYMPVLKLQLFHFLLLLYFHVEHSTIMLVFLCNITKYRLYYIFSVSNMFSWNHRLYRWPRLRLAQALPLVDGCGVQPLRRSGPPPYRELRVEIFFDICPYVPHTLIHECGITIKSLCNDLLFKDQPI